MAKQIILTEEEREKKFKEGVQYLKQKNPELDEKDIELKIKEIIDICQNPDAYGWKRPPADFDKRFDSKTGKLLRENRWEKKTKKKTKKKNKKNVYVKSGFDVDHSIAKEIIDLGVFDENEQKIIKDLSKKYQEEFTFNTTSDRVLLKDLILTEIKLLRFNKQVLQPDYVTKKNDIDIKDKLENSILNIQKHLGITRQQRDAHLEKSAKSISELSVTLEEKLKNIEEEEEKDLQEELRFNQERIQRAPINSPLSVDEMHNILSGVEREELSPEELELAKDLTERSMEQSEKVKEEEKKERPVVNAIKA